MLGRHQTGLGLLAFAAIGLAISLIKPAQSSTPTAQHGYLFAISTGPGLQLAESSRQISTSDLASLACEKVIHLGAFSFGSQCGQAIKAP